MPVDKKVKLGKGVKIPFPKLVNLYGCSLGDGVFVGPFVEIQQNVVIGKNSRVSSHSFICDGVEIGEDVFIGHGVMFINDMFDSPNIKSWRMRKIKVENKVRIGTNATILPVTIGSNSIIGAGAVVTRSVPKDSTVAGNPARVLKYYEKK